MLTRCLSVCCVVLALSGPAALARQWYSEIIHVHTTFSDGSGNVPQRVELAKGLEFDAVMIHDAGKLVYGAESERTLLYTACTRALHSLSVYFTGEPSPLLPLHKPELFLASAHP